MSTSEKKESNELRQRMFGLVSAVRQSDPNCPWQEFYENIALAAYEMGKVDANKGNTCQTCKEPMSGDCERCQRLWSS